MYYDQRRIGDFTSVRTGSELNNDYRQREKYREQDTPTCSQQCSYCSRPILTGLLVGMLVAGVGFAVFLTFYLTKEDSKITCATMITTAQSTTIASTTTTSVTVTTTSSTASTTTTTISALNVNLVVNGDGETGSCAMDNNVKSPTGWSFSGPITQMSYSNTAVTDQQYSTSGPSNRGQCYFLGKVSVSTSMWQTIDLTNKVNFLLIDSQTIRYNLSAWLGGISNQDDNAVVSLSFFDSNNQLLVMGNNTNIGPIFAADRGSQSSLIYQQTDGLVPVGTRSMLVCVTLTRTNGVANNGNIDNLALVLY